VEEGKKKVTGWLRNLGRKPHGPCWDRSHIIISI